MDAGHISRLRNGQPVIPDELIFEILTRLPAKSLLKFRCVSKCWLAMISSREFINAHVKKLENDDELTYHSVFTKFLTPRLHLKQLSIKSILEKPKTPAVRIDFPGEEPPITASVLGCCNGLVCVVLDEKDLYLWNPCTRKSKKLPLTGCMANARHFTGSGFGYNESRDDYNVVLFSSRIRGQIELVLYSLRTDSWTRIDGIPASFPRRGSAMFVNGKLHWPARSMLAISLDLAQIEIGGVEFPSCMNGAPCLIIGVLDKCLSVNCVYLWNMDLWIMREYGVVESWTKVASIQPCQIPVCISGKGEILVALSSDFGLYNMRKRSLKYREIEGIEEIDLEGDIYIESLVSPITSDDDDAERLHGQQRQE